MKHRVTHWQEISYILRVVHTKGRRTGGVLEEIYINYLTMLSHDDDRRLLWYDAMGDKVE
jgi:hypothetical protein